jgi:hypothetical protein
MNEPLDIERARGILRDLELSPATKLKALITTLSAMLSSFREEFEADSELGRSLGSDFGWQLAQVLDVRGLVSSELGTRAGREFGSYVDEVAQLLSGSASECEVQARVTAHRARLLEVLAVEAMDARLSVASNAISVALLAVCNHLVRTHGKVDAMRRVRRALDSVGGYSCGSLFEYLKLEGDGPLLRVLKVFGWIFINGNPEMRVRLHAVDARGFTLYQHGQCRQWENARALAIADQLEWPVNQPTFCRVAAEFAPASRLEIPAGQCLGNAECEFRVRWSGDP